MLRNKRSRRKLSGKEKHMGERKILQNDSNSRGITLVALVITIIVLIILSTVAINFIFGDNGLIRRAEQAKELAEESSKAEANALSDLEEQMDYVLASESGYSELNGVNIPKLREGMIPVYYDTDSQVWRKADESNQGNQWYDYAKKQWANIVTVSDEDSSLRDAEVGTEIPMDKITTFFVWIPRYAYSIDRGYKEGNVTNGHIDVTFLKGTTNTGSDGVDYATDYDESQLQPGDTTPAIVHPVFSQGGKELTGIWIAKFEASGTNSSGEAVGNSDNDATYTSVQPDSSTYVKILPSKVSWRNINVGESEYRSMQMSTNTSAYGWSEDVNSHLMKNSEWGAVAYLCYSDYGAVPMTNGAGNSTNGYYYNLYTGAGPRGENDERMYSNFTEETYGYNTELGVLASTTGNVYGIYDMAGGSWERVAAYLDNGNEYLTTYGKSSSSDVTYFENGKLKSEYSSLWEAYTVSDEEANNAIRVGEETLTQSELWDWNKRGIEYNQARYRLTKANFDNLPKGIGVREMASPTTNTFSYYAPYGSTNGNWNWFTEVKDTSVSTGAGYGRAWDNDYVLIGHAYRPFVTRGGTFDYGSSAGVLLTNFTHGTAYSSIGFRPALAF